MKKLLALTLALVLALGVLACAEELPYLHQLVAENYSNVLLLPKELCPTVWLSNGSSSWLFVWGYYSRSTYFTFPSPEGMLCNEFQPNYASFVNDDEAIQYSYQVFDEYSDERLFNKCSDKKYIIFDGSDGIAAYIDLEREEADAVICLDGISAKARLYVRLMYNFSSTDTAARRTEVLTSAAKTELPRIRSQIRYHSMSGASDYWTYNAFAGFLSPSLEFGDFGIHFDLSTQLTRRLGSMTQSAPLFVAEMDDNKYTMFAEFEAGVSIQVTLNLETYSYVVDSIKKDSPGEVFTLADKSGNIFECYASGYKNLDNKLEYSHLKTSLLLSDKAGYYANKNYYLNIDFDLYGFKFSDNEATRKSEMSRLLNEVMSGIHSFDPADYPYVPKETASQPQNEPAPEATAFRNGIRWGASPEEVLAGENTSAFLSDVALTGRFADASELVYAKRLNTKLSKYSAGAIYYFVDDGVQLADIYLSDADGSAAKYLRGAFTKAYGAETGENQTDPVLAKAAEAMGLGYMYSAPIACWQPADDVAIQMFRTGSTLEIFYINSAYDIDTLLDVIEPEYDLSGL